MRRPADITAIVAAFDRPQQTRDTIGRIAACDPPPAQIVVHVDGGHEACAAALRDAPFGARLMVSDRRLGPGGSRNRLIASAETAWAASFDDDSWPVDADFFARCASVIARESDAAVIAASLRSRAETSWPHAAGPRETASFGSGAALFRRAAFIEAGGFVPLTVAYGMEEEDLALRLFDRGWSVRLAPELRVFHDADLARHADPQVNAGALANVALLAYLRYPKRYWPYGALQVVNRVAWSLAAGRTRGLVSGLLSIPRHLHAHHAERAPVAPETMRRRRALRARDASAAAVEPARIVSEERA